jgi:hypothetical protein
MNGLAAISEITGLKRNELKGIWAKVKANQRRLDGCPGPHDFQDASPDKAVGKDYVCSKCQGKVQGPAFRWYTKGLEHARLAADGRPAPKPKS